MFLHPKGLHPNLSLWTFVGAAAGLGFRRTDQELSGWDRQHAKARDGSGNAFLIIFHLGGARGFGTFDGEGGRRAGRGLGILRRGRLGRQCEDEQRREKHAEPVGPSEGSVALMIKLRAREVQRSRCASKKASIRIAWSAITEWPAHTIWIWLKTSAMREGSSAIQTWKSA